MYYLGIDIAKDKFDVALVTDDVKANKAKHKVFTNNPAGFGKLMLWLKCHSTGDLHVAMEATGTYYEDLAEFLSDAGIMVSVINPACISSHKRSCSIRNDVDSACALVIADFCRTKRPKLWTPPPAEYKELRELGRRLSILEQAKQDEENRLSAGVGSAVVERSIRESIKFLDKEIEMINQIIKDHIDSHPDLKKKLDLLVSIPGIAEKTAAILLGEIPNIENFESARQVSAYAGLSPKQRRSGTSVIGKTRLSKQGNKRLRKALFFPAISATQHNPVVKEHYLRLRQAGKTKMCAIGAAMRKLLHIVFGVLIHETPFTTVRDTVS